MCSRIDAPPDDSQFRIVFDAAAVSWNFWPGGERRPTNQIAIVRAGDEGRLLEAHRWWLVPGWWKKDLKELPSLFNARSEGIETKPSFRSAFKARRCLIPVSGFYEWSGPKGAKVKHRIARTDGALLALAGLWEEWQQPDGTPLRSCTIITTTPNAVMEPIHNRMPVILGPDDWDEWLQPHPRPAELLHLLRPCPAEWIEARPA